MDTSFFRHPKVLALGNTALARTARDLYIAALAYSRANLTDGFLPREALGELDPLTGQKLAETAALLLVTVGLLQRLKGPFRGYQIRDYAAHQQTKADVESAKEAARRRKRDERARGRVTGMSQRDTPAGHAVTPTPVTPTEVEQKKKEKRHRPLDQLGDWKPLPIDFEKERELLLIHERLGRTDDKTMDALRRAAASTSFSGCVRVRESLQAKPRGKFAVGYAISALRSEAEAA